MDAVRRKLEFIDKQLAWQKDFHKQIVSTAPLLFAGVGLIAGIVVQSTLDLPVLLWWVLLGVCMVAAVVFFILQSRKEAFVPCAIGYTALVCFACLGGIRLASYHRAKSDDIRHLVGDERRLATIRGVILTEPYVDKQRWEFAGFRRTDPGSSFYLRLKEVEAVDGWTKASGTVRVQVAEPVLDLKTGDSLQMYCWLDRFAGASNPGQFDTAKYLARKNVLVGASVKSRDGIEVLESSGLGIFTKVKRKLRESATRALVGELSVAEQSRGLLEALLLGYRGNIDSETYRAFRKTGLLHFISLSGLHVGILMGTVWWLCKAAGLLKRARAIICIIAIGVFLMVVPLRSPTLRAAVIGFVFCLSFFFRRYSNPLNTLSLAAITLLLIRPTGLFEAGWQLSFASVLGILVFNERVANFLHEITGDWFWNIPLEDVSVLRRLAKRFGKAVVALFSVGFTAWLGGAGILLYHFYTITPLASVWTVLVFPFVWAILVLGFLKIILFFLLPTLSAVLGVMVRGLSQWLIWAVKSIADLGVSQILVGCVPLVLVIFYYVFFVFAAFVYFRRPAIRKATCTVMILAMVVFLGVTKWERTCRDSLELTCLDVGHGQAILAKLPGGENILFDAGSLYKGDIGRRIVTSFLDYSGINEIDTIVISHGDLDHINGVPEIIEHCKVNSVYANDAFLSQTEQEGNAKFLKESLKNKGLEIRSLGKDLNLSSSARIRILWPSKEVCANSQFDDNDKSVVSLIEFAGAGVLLSSDIENVAQRELLRLVPKLGPEVVFVPHHGSVSTLEADFLDELGADVLIYSCSRRQYERQQIYKCRDTVKAFYTPKDGAVTVCIDSDGTIRTNVFVKQK
ncbi:MAG: DNA internalization-related competence protein ComEC/Rec2 [Planctomycetota bacterium]|nr:MAG: DNA internalization-related competence protein ComEC/Rec2 [Planctomycetota bacterium]